MARRLVREQGKDATFFVIGETHEQAYDRHVRQYAVENGLADRVIFTGRRDDIPDVLASLDVLVTLSGGSVMIEAMACGTPVVSAGFTPSAESTIVLDGRTGLVVEANELDTATARLIGDAGLRERLARSARQHAESNYSHLTLVAKTQQTYERLLGNGAGQIG